MTRKRILVVAGIVAVGAAAVAIAAGPCDRGMMRHDAMRAAADTFALEAAPGRFDAKRLAGALKLTPAQQPLWDAYVATLAPPDGSAPAWAHASNAPARLEAALVTARQREQAAQARLAAMNALYAALTAEQKTTFDHAARFPRGPRWFHG